MAAIHPRVPSEGGKISVVSTTGHLAVCAKEANY